MESGNLESLRFNHGNPTLLLPSADCAGRLIITAQDGQLIWSSYLIPQHSDAVKVNVANGWFTGIAEGWALLSAGNYSAFWQPSNSPPQPLATVQIASRRVFECSHSDPLQADSAWLPSPLNRAAGFHAEFREGSMHGELTSEFLVISDLVDGDEFGLIIRHYNAFHHMRLRCRRESSGLSIALLRSANTPPDLESGTVICQTALPLPIPSKIVIRWSFNGTSHEVSANGQSLFRSHDDYMGGVEIVGFYSGTRSVACNHIALDTTQAVGRHTINKPEYTAEIRPGNIGRLLLRQSEAPTQSLMWESGVQFGHIGGSEIKFTQCASLHVMDEGPVASSVTWDGPCPKFVERSDDIRGRADGITTFFHDHFVIADNVLTWTARSVGPDIDLLGRLLDGPARLALAGSDTFQDWPLHAEGAMSVIPTPAGQAAYPAALAIPMRLGPSQWWLKVLIILRSPDATSTPAIIFAWQCPHGLTASHDFRCAPTKPGQEYAFTIAVAWQQCNSGAPVEEELLKWRNRWTQPMQIRVKDGGALPTMSTSDGMREAMNRRDAFDLSTGMYVLEPHNCEALQLDPAGLSRPQPVFRFRKPHGTMIGCSLDETPLQPEKDYLSQYTAGGDLLLQLLVTLDKPRTLTLNFKRETTT